MSLKAFHVVFISASVLLALGMGVAYLKTNLVGGIGALAVGVALIGYETWFLKKSRSLS